MIEGFEDRVIDVDGVRLAVSIGGSGPPLLLIHGYPQMRACWRLVAPELARRFTVVCPDLRGYGDSDKPVPGPRGEGYSKREMAGELVGLMRTLSFDRWSVVGHDRGARVAYRMALDSPDVLNRLVLLDIVPTLEMFEKMNVATAYRAHAWFFLAQPSPYPETLLAGAPDYYVRHLLTSWSADPAVFSEDMIATYVAAFTPAIPTMCGDYRAGYHLDPEIDRADRDAGRKISCPTLVLWGGGVDSHWTDAALDLLPLWQDWCTDVDGRSLPCEHFIPEEAPGALLEELDKFLRAPSPI